ncbi:hypothetical protein N231_05670 [Geobacillus stearothermophilus ATCC 12980]|uniref:L-aspartate oxidase n=1 Tax=Geobacillus stearothermophilus TaxID=1422 RepID=A0A150MJE3_GEOSE|nr:hypothetical protein N231_05670 [Geobacillus stearothermophilus ATCC 12980]KYD24558.1 L-aspartate oxidase [Geobacillus stearothermophilus]
MGEGGVVIVGSGLAVLTVAYYLPRHENVMIFTKKGRSDSNSWRAQGGVADMEFIQFHPTMLATIGKAVGLVSEAVRGEGAVLETEDGRRLVRTKEEWACLPAGR